MSEQEYSDSGTGRHEFKLQNAEDTRWEEAAYMTSKEDRDSVQHYHGEVGDDGSIKQENKVSRTNKNSLSFYG